MADQLADPDGCPFSGFVTDNGAKVCLDMQGNIWSTSIWVHAALADHESLARCNIS
ncbi:hypothetical protein H8A99_23020 [Bradyrhizobium sp. Arg68]|uniref:hypothetical protein n=1 Tax=Bradyrhizobium ivorense TaxID=2511166 RepID=UPI001E349B28|nr:hypothetical protein [Bradyrhizobium ivorense]MCC8939266.1 hypothetical protein [Bradyrhizobium ivorense]